jgi:hypothetical protein
MRGGDKESFGQAKMDGVVNKMWRKDSEGKKCGHPFRLCPNCK